MNALTTLWRRWTGPIREFGFLAGLLYGTDRLLSAASPACRVYCYELMVQPIQDGALAGARFTGQLELREIRCGDPEVALMPAREDIKAERYAQGAMCLGAFRKESFIGYIWFAFSRYEEDEVRCSYRLSPPREAVFDFDLYIFPEHRMGLAFVGIWNEANKYLKSRGVRYTYSRLTRFNVASRRAHTHLGWKKVGNAAFLQIAGLEIMAADVAPYFHVGLRRSQRVKLQLRPDALTQRDYGASRAATQRS